MLGEADYLEETTGEVEDVRVSINEVWPPIRVQRVDVKANEHDLSCSIDENGKERRADVMVDVIGLAFISVAFEDYSGILGLNLAVHSDGNVGDTSGGHRGGLGVGGLTHILSVAFAFTARTFATFTTFTSFASFAKAGRKKVEEAAKSLNLSSTR